MLDSDSNLGLPIEGLGEPSSVARENTRKLVLGVVVHQGGVSLARPRLGDATVDGGDHLARLEPLK